VVVVVLAAVAAASTIFQSIDGMQVVYEGFISDVTDIVPSSFRPFFLSCFYACAFRSPSRERNKV
jgi:hypothetical protein